MTEIQLVNIAAVKLAVVALMGYIYARAGRGWKWPILGKVRRRIYLPMILTICLLLSAIVTGSFTWRLFLIIGITFPIYYISMSIGYGASSPLRRWFGRVGQQFVVGALQGSSCILLALYTGKWGLYVLCVFIPALVLGTLGGWADSDVNASFKEALVGCSLFLFPLFLL